MPIYVDSIPYMIARQKRVALPRTDDTNKLGFGNLVFLFTNNIGESIRIINNTDNLYHDGKYYYYYYNLQYSGTIAGRRYYIKDLQERKQIYQRISKETAINPHPPSLLNATPNKNCYFEMSKYFEIYRRMTQKFTPIRKLELFWSYFKSIWMSEQTSMYKKKWILINADLFGEFNGTLNDMIGNPLFLIYYTLYKKFDLIKDLDIEFIIYCKHTVLRINPSKENEKSYNIFKRELKKVYNRVTGLDSLNEKDIDIKIQKEELKNTLVQKYNFTGENDTSIVTDLKSVDKKDDDISSNTVSTKISEKIDKVSNDISSVISDDDKTSKEVADYIQTQAEMELDNDKELIETMYKVMSKEKVPSKPVSTVRDAQMRERQEQLLLGNTTIKELQKINAAKKVIPVKDVSRSVHTVNPNMRKIKFANINKDYIDNVMATDIVNVFTCLNEKSSKLYVRNISVQDSSNELNYKETYKITLEDEHKQRHEITVDIPKFIDHKFMYLGGNKKIIDKQNFLFPVVKTAPDTVQIVSNYNKMFIRRIGTKSISSVQRMMKMISTNEEAYKYFTIGNNSSTNRSYITTIEYDEFGKVITKFKSDYCEIFFNQADATGYAEMKDIKIPNNYIFIGIKNNNPVFIDIDTQLTTDNQSICDLIYAELPETMQAEFGRTRNTKKVMYNTVTLMSQTIPFIILLLYWEGITSVFNKLHLKYYFSDKYPSEVKTNESVIRFKDCYFVYEEDLAISLLMNGMRMLDTESYNMEEFNTAEPYIPFFKKVYGKVSIINAISNFYDFMIDPITKEILEDINLPTDLVNLCIYASNLLVDETYTIENSQLLSRIRSTEVIPAMLYKEISTAFINYTNSAGKKKLSIPRDCVIKRLLALQTVEDYSVLNPVVELEKDRAITSKGFNGINVDRAYTEEKRSYDDTMIGVMAMSTSPDGNVGINRFLTMEPEITTARGYVNIKADKKQELKDVNLFSPAELLYPLGNTRDDSIRTAMACKQSKHVIPVKNSIPALISNGSDEIIKYELSSDFVVMADEDGQVVDFDEKSQVMMVQYKSGINRAIDLSSHVVKNGAGGFYLANQLCTDLKVGDKFKRDQTLAYHKDFFKEDKLTGVRMNVGALEKVAIISSYATYNDSTAITHKLSKDVASDMTFCKPIVLGKHSNVYSYKSVGDHVEIGDSLLDFDVSFDDSDLNKLLSHLSDENKDMLAQSSMNSVKSKYAGKIIDIKIYSTVELEELSESLQKIVKNYYNKIEKKKNFVSKYDKDNTSIVKCGLLLNETTGKVEPNIYGVVKGEKVEDSVLIEYYIEHEDVLGVGDKVA